MKDSFDYNSALQLPIHFQILLLIWAICFCISIFPFTSQNMNHSPGKQDYKKNKVTCLWLEWIWESNSDALIPHPETQLSEFCIVLNQSLLLRLSPFAQDRSHLMWMFSQNVNTNLRHPFSLCSSHRVILSLWINFACTYSKIVKFTFLRRTITQ